MDIKRIIINKNRGWRGLAEVKCYNSEHKDIKTMIFSFSPAVWDDMLAGYIVIPDDTYYHILNFDHREELPKGQRSVLIKSFNANVLHVKSYLKTETGSIVEPRHKLFIEYYINKKNNHTTSDWNCVGIRVIPSI